jgi:hypothetical protein
MKTVVLKGITGLTNPTPVAREKIPENRAGWFHYTSSTNEDGNPIVITFKQEILVDKALSKAELADVIKHERVHEADFQRLARQLKKALDAAYKKSDDVDLGPWLEWFDYDNCSASAHFHRQIEAPIEICFTPNSARPK